MANGPSLASRGRKPFVSILATAVAARVPIIRDLLAAAALLMVSNPAVNDPGPPERAVCTAAAALVDCMSDSAAPVSIALIWNTFERRRLRFFLGACRPSSGPHLNAPCGPFAITTPTVNGVNLLL